MEETLETKKSQNNHPVSTKKAADFLGVSISTVYRMVETGALEPSKTPGGQRRFDMDTLENFKEASKSIEAPQKPSKFKKDNAIESLVDERKPVDKRNSLNDLNGTEWLPATKSYMYQKGLGSKHPHAQIERMHPAPYSFQDIEQLITFFTKKGARVLDPFGGIGSTAKACELNGRFCTSIELQETWSELAKERIETEVSEGASKKHDFITGDSRELLRNFEDSSFDFMVTSPPYWSILNKKADHKVKDRVSNNLATNYSDGDARDLGNVQDYDEFLKILVDDFFMESGRVLRPNKYMCLVVSDFRNKSKFISFHSDLIQAMDQKLTSDGYQMVLQGVKVLIQNHKSLLPYGYPFAYVENIHHQYILIFRKMEAKKA
ncbi:helix-turn-helix domain-containing protein [Candidatus Saccharibacteria bacterium]|nr:helix-turn-helix domain-containing protein [Candidatus Saccharibacteria bacterium]